MRLDTEHVLRGSFSKVFEIAAHLDKGHPAREHIKRVLSGDLIDRSAITISSLREIDENSDIAITIYLQEWWIADVQDAGNRAGLW